jgi:hypothetical protein
VLAVGEVVGVGEAEFGTATAVLQSAIVKNKARNEIKEKIRDVLSGF